MAHRDSRKTQELPTIETSQDLLRTDPLHVFTHRDCYAPELGVRQGRPTRQWSRARGEGGSRGPGSNRNFNNSKTLGEQT